MTDNDYKFRVGQVIKTLEIPYGMQVERVTPKFVYLRDTETLGKIKMRVDYLEELIADAHAVWGSSEPPPEVPLEGARDKASLRTRIPSELAQGLLGEVARARKKILDHLVDCTTARERELLEALAKTPFDSAAAYAHSNQEMLRVMQLQTLKYNWRSVRECYLTE